MLKTLLLASLFALPVAAQPAPPTPPGPPTGPAPAACRAKGDATLEVDVFLGDKLQRATTLYGNGAVIRRDWNKDDKPTGISGPACLPDPTLAQIKKELAAAPYKVTTYEITCMAMSAGFTQYKVDGKLVFTEKLCGHEGLDDASAKALHDADQIIEKLTAPDPITTSRGKPVK